jgi:hypothetical protein|tara:strand:+ start:3063 stop:3224 length:162 start_codon:yes stop_codon:yes gene_type:complete
MPLSATVVPSVSGGHMTAEYLSTFMTDIVPSGGTLIQILETGPRMVLIYDDGN